MSPRVNARSCMHVRSNAHAVEQTRADTHRGGEEAQQSPPAACTMQSTPAHKKQTGHDDGSRREQDPDKGGTANGEPEQHLSLRRTIDSYFQFARKIGVNTTPSRTTSAAASNDIAAVSPLRRAAAPDSRQPAGIPSAVVSAAGRRTLEAETAQGNTDADVVDGVPSSSTPSARLSPASPMSGGLAGPGASPVVIESGATLQTPREWGEGWGADDFSESSESGSDAQADVMDRVSLVSSRAMSLDAPVSPSLTLSSMASYRTHARARTLTHTYTHRHIHTNTHTQPDSLAREPIGSELVRGSLVVAGCEPRRWEDAIFGSESESAPGAKGHDTRDGGSSIVAKAASGGGCKADDAGAWKGRGLHATRHQMVCVCMCVCV